MGARAHGRRHNGRAIRKWQRIGRRWTASLKGIGHAANAAAKTIEEFGTTLTSTMPQDGRPGGASELSGQGVPYPTQSGVEDAREAARRSEIEERIDASAVRLGIELLPWQRELAIDVLLGGTIVWHGGRSGGRWTVQQVVKESTVHDIERQS